MAHCRHVVEVTPAFRPGYYHLTARNHVGRFDTPGYRYDIRPKVPWPTVRMLLGLRHDGGHDVDPDGGLFGMLAGELAARLREVARIGLVSGYVERDAVTPFLRGKLRPAEHFRDAAARAFPDRFHVTETVLDLDTPWNRIPRHVTDRLLSHPGLSTPMRVDLRSAALEWQQVPDSPPAEADFATAGSDPRAAHYGPLLAVCRLLHDGFAAACFKGHGGRGAFLIDLSRAFERFLTNSLRALFATRPAWSVEVEPGFSIGPTALQPDLVVRKRGQAWAVLDAKWKSAGTAPDAADLHQILAYAAVTGANHVGLAYPGRRFAHRILPVAGRDTRVSLFRVRVIGTDAECSESVTKLARIVRREFRSPRV
jgi:5-methylcytosine-specific restriction enzyme subunit McrC